MRTPPMAAMNGVELAWMAMVAAGLTLALLHLLVWVRQRERRDFLLFFVLAASAAGFGVFESVIYNIANQVGKSRPQRRKRGCRQSNIAISDDNPWFGLTETSG